jgi:fructokinase
MIGAIEAGGTKVVCAVANDLEALAIAPRRRIPTTDPRSTIERVAATLAELTGDESLEAIGVASFGPLLATRGSIAPTTPKIAWRGLNWRTALAEHLGQVPIGLDTDTNAAALAEASLGAGRGEEVVAYVTVGTGIGGGIAVAGRPIHGALHPELGHLRIRRRADDDYAGGCPHHGDCLEGLAAGPAVHARTGASAEDLDPDHPVFDLVAGYLGSLCANLALVLAPNRLILGGGVMGTPGLLDHVRRATAVELAGYLPISGYSLDGPSAIVAPGLGADAGITGAWLLGRRAFEQR